MEDGGGLTRESRSHDMITHQTRKGSCIGKGHSKLNNIDLRAWFADVLARLPDHPAKRIDELLPWNW